MKMNASVNSSFDGRLLDDRLLSAGCLVRKKSRAADIGCDHAYLSIWLVKNGICTKVIASDLREGPLSSARQNVNEAGLSGIVDLRLGAGLDKISGDEVDDIIICGMGGITIADIIEAAPWVKDGAKHLVLQPMTHADVLREYLCKNGFEIDKETAVVAAKKVYTVISAVYTGEITSPGELFYKIGKIAPQKDGADILYIKKELHKLKKKSQGIARSNHPEDEGAFSVVIGELEGLIARREEEKICNNNKQR